MESTFTRPAVDVGPKQARAGLALLLAVLSIPGSTVAWALPMGVWIGLPLGVAAIVLAVRARRDGVTGAGPAMAVAAIVLAGLAIGQMVVYTAVSIVS
jgi:hypothetical protein